MSLLDRALVVIFEKESSSIRYSCELTIRAPCISPRGWWDVYFEGLVCFIVELEGVGAKEADSGAGMMGLVW